MAISTEAVPIVFLSTGAEAYRLGRGMFETVCVMRTIEREVVWPVIRTVPVKMVDYFRRRQEAVQVARHHIAVFQNVTVAVGHGMSSADTDLHVPGVVLRTSSAPDGTFGTGHVFGPIGRQTLPAAEVMWKTCAWVFRKIGAAVVADQTDHSPPPFVESVREVRGNSERSREFGCTALAAPFIIPLRAYQRGTDDAHIALIRV